jgi:drug/metabolite transporter (DMT)-like permease
MLRAMSATDPRPAAPAPAVRPALSAPAAWLAFAAVSLVWGLTWFPAKIALARVPPLLFTGTRFLVAGLILAAWVVARGGTVIPPPAARARLLAVTALSLVLCPALVFWGLARTPSGLAAVVNLTLVPIGLYGFGLLAGEERRERRLDLALALGVFGLGLLFARRVAGGGEIGLVGLAAIVVGTLAHPAGWVTGRRVTRALDPVAVSAATMALGGAALVALSLALERPDAAVFAAFLEPEVAAAWLFLVFGGSLVAYTLSFVLLREWGPLRSGLTAFVSPIIAAFAGWLVLGERFGALELAGMAAMLASTLVALWRPGGLR